MASMVIFINPSIQKYSRMYFEKRCKRYQVMNKKSAVTLLVSCLIGILSCLFIYFVLLENKELNEKLKRQDQVQDSLKVVIKGLEKEYDSLQKVKQEKIIEYITLKSDLEKQQDETDSIVNSVYTLDERQLDSTIRSHKHIKRTKD